MTPDELTEMPTSRGLERAALLEPEPARAAR